MATARIPAEILSKSEDEARRRTAFGYGTALAQE
jgi:hypothetical protein